MDNKQLIKVVKALVEVEVAKKHELFLKNQFPKILDEAVQNKMKTLKNTTNKQVVSEEVDPFKLANQVLQNERQEQPTRQFTKNQALNEVLNQTQPFTKEQRSGGVGVKSVLDSFQQPMNESMDKTVAFTQGGAGAGLDGMRASMASQMGYGDMPGVSGTKEGGLGVQTGFSHLDKVLNRDYSQLVKKFKK
jgi:hypothetical protein